MRPGLAVAALRKLSTQVFRHEAAFLQCKYTASGRTSATMALPEIIQSSPLGIAPRDVFSIESSSPGLPCVDDIVSRTTAGGAKGSAGVGNTENNSETRSPSGPRFIQNHGEDGSRNIVLQNTAADGEEPSVLIVERSSKLKSKARKPKKEKAAPKKPKAPTKKATQAAESADTTKEPVPKKTRVRKKARSKTVGDGKDDEKLAVAEASDAGQEMDATSKHFARDIETPDKKAEKTPIEPLGLEFAMPRRLDWTPPTAKAPIVIDTSSQAEELRSPGQDASRQHSFGDLLSAYGCAEHAQLSGDKPDDASAQSVLKKRKLVELVTVKQAGDNSGQTILEKPAIKKKAVRKKPQTITALATAAYKVTTPPEADGPSASLLDYFPPAANDDDGSTATKKPNAKPRKRTAKASKKKPEPPKPILLSPTTALRQVANQDYVFGTSSQLAREQSPSILRDIQAAIKASNEINTTMFDDLPNSDAVEIAESRPKLWGAGARDAEGDLLDLEIIDLVDQSPQLPPQRSEPDPFGYFGKEEGSVAGGLHNANASREGDDSSLILSDVLLPPPRFLSRRALETATSPVILPQADLGKPDVPAAAPGEALDTIQHGEVGPAAQAHSHAPDTHDEAPPRPDYDLYTDAQLSREVTKFGFKPVKRRNAMSALLDQCWQSMARAGSRGGAAAATFSTSTPAAKARVAGLPRDQSAVNRTEPVFSDGSDIEIQEPPPSAQPPPASPKRPRGRPRKDATSPSSTKPKKAAATKKKKAASPRTPPKAGRAKSPRKSPVVVVEIPDSASDDGFSSDSSLSSVDEIFSSPNGVDVSISTTEGSELPLNAMAIDQSQEALMACITKAVTSAPRSTDTSNPSWHEKMLLYDPIVLEDLTAWLNSGQLTLVGYDGEVSPGEVKQWCESKSICCLWRVNLRGKERKRF
ncbi:hypothetical protein B0I35DRAFT_435180 [Stachybotrys elegans]|uniref:Structure-specific endonuclease subunit SLX4 n=1 Tax=Stachybotrys elegans TaxID=80388 RepID=A0A8K0ST15_9HYPO|nr:hypothetical protein B0I35DRAFT_435180 [Stachybotrys elegans]